MICPCDWLTDVRAQAWPWLPSEVSPNGGFLPLLQVFRYSTALEKHKLFISGLPFSCTKEELEDICKAHGTVKDLRLVTNRAGKPKVSTCWVS